jgi:hypothetical protein
LCTALSAQKDPSHGVNKTRRQLQHAGEESAFGCRSLCYMAGWQVCQRDLPSHPNFLLLLTSWPGDAEGDEDEEEAKDVAFTDYTATLAFDNDKNENVAVGGRLQWRQ